MNAWQGGVTITSINTTCEENFPGLKVGDLMSSVFRPRLVGTDPSSTLTMLRERLAVAFVRQTGNDQMNGQGTYAGLVIKGRATVVQGGATGDL